MMNIILWVIAGGAAGWVGYTYINLNEKRGLTVSLVIGMLGGYFGGKIIAPMLGAGTAVNPGDFSPFPLIVAFASAAAVLVVSSMVHKRFGF